MSEPFYPFVDLSFIQQQAQASEKFHDFIKIGSTTTIVTKGNQAIYKRCTLLRELEPGKICLEQATAIALKFNLFRRLIKMA